VFPRSPILPDLLIVRFVCLILSVVAFSVLLSLFFVVLFGVLFTIAFYVGNIIGASLHLLGGPHLSFYF
jgi:hypothetical protein